MYGGKDFSERGETLLQDLYILVIRRESLRVVSYVRQEPVDFKCGARRIFQGKSNNLLQRRIVANTLIVSNITSASDVMVRSIFRTKRSSRQLTVTN